MTTDYRNLTVQELTNYLYNDCLVCNQPILFSFDTRKKVSSHDRAVQTWYMLSLLSCEEICVAVIVSDQGTELESQVITRKVYLDEFVDNYCKTHNPKYNGKVCVDIGYWTDCEWNALTGEWR